VHGAGFNASLDEALTDVLGPAFREGSRIVLGQAGGGITGDQQSLVVLFRAFGDLLQSEVVAA
jgi:hypothetical protein